MKTVRVGIIGMGNAGALHLKALLEGQVPGAALTAVVCRPERAAALSGTLPPGVRVFHDEQELYASGLCDAVIVATPHPAHPRQVISSLRAGLHVMCEKPAGVSATEAREMARVARETGRVYSLNFNRRTVPAYVELRELVRGGTLGEVRRAAWTTTVWLRVQAYFDSSPWRGTWAGEGGGMLLNQLPHALDIVYWTLGMPTRLLGRCGLGKYHDIEVEDEVHVLAEYGNGAILTLIGSTGEAPGFERIELVGTKASAVLENNALTISRLSKPLDEFIRDAPGPFDRPRITQEVIRVDGEGDLITGITRDFTESIQTGRPLLAPGEDGIASLELANAILLSHWDEKWVMLPLDSERFDTLLKERQSTTRSSRPASANVVDLKQSFHVPTSR